jgi:hypothetical protein
MEWITVVCPVCGEVVKIKNHAKCNECGVIIELDQDAIPLGLADKIKIICICDSKKMKIEGTK